MASYLGPSQIQFRLLALIALHTTPSIASAECAFTPPSPDFHYGGMKYVLTPNVYESTPSVQEKIAAEYGSSAKLAELEEIGKVLYLSTRNTGLSIISVPAFRTDDSHDRI